jgi:hypothetical protein
MTRKKSASAGTKKIVIPAEAGIQRLCSVLKNWIPASAGMTGKKNAEFRAVAG